MSIRSFSSLSYTRMSMCTRTYICVYVVTFSSSLAKTYSLPFPSFPVFLLDGEIYVCTVQSTYSMPAVRGSKRHLVLLSRTHQHSSSSPVAVSNTSIYLIIYHFLRLVSFV